MIKTMTGPLRYQFAIIIAFHLACVLVLASEVPHDLVRRQADEVASQIVSSNSNPSQNSLNGDPSSDLQKVEVRPSDWRFLELLQVNSSAPHNIIEAENNPEEWHALASTLLHHSFVADQIMQYQLSRLLGDGEAETNSSYVPYYLDQSARIVAGLNDSAPDDLFQSMGMMVVGHPCLTSSNKGHVSALLVALPDVPSPIVQIDQKVTDKDDPFCETEDPPNSQKVEVEYLGGVYDNTDELSSLNSSSMSYMMFLLTGRIDKRSLAVRVDQDMTVVRNITDDCDETTTEMPTTTPTGPIDPIPEEEVDTIVQVIEDVDGLDCNETVSEYSQSVIIENKYEMDDFEKALSRLQESEDGHCVIEAVYSQDTNSTANATWYYMDQHDLVWTEVEEEYETDIHIGHGLVVILPLISNNGSLSYVILAKTFIDEPASPIVQIQQAFIDHSGCGCVEEEASGDGTNVTHYVSQHFEHRYNYSDLALDLDSMTDYIRMLEAVPPFERQYIDIIAFNEIEGPDCNETTTTMETTSTVETTTPEETTTVETTTPEETTTVETTTPEETTTMGPTTTGETTTPSTTAETTMATEPPTTTSGPDRGSTSTPTPTTTVEITTVSGTTLPTTTEITGPTTTAGITTTGSTVTTTEGPTTTAGPTVITTEGPTTTAGPTVTTAEVPGTEQTAPITQAPDVETTIQTTTKAPVTEPPVTAAPTQAPDTETTTKEQTEPPVTQAPDTETTTKTEEQTEAPATAAPAPDTETTTKEQTEAPATAAPAPDTETTTKEETKAPTAAPAPDTETTTKAQKQTEAPATPAPAPDTETTTKEQTAAPVTAAPVTAAPAPETTTKAKEQTEAPTAAPAPETTTKAKEQTEPPVTAAPVPAPETTTKAQEQTEAPVTAAPAPETTTKAKEQTEAPVTAAPVPAPETTTKAKEEQTDAPATAAPAPETTTKAKEQTDSPVTAAPVPAPETTKAPEPVTEAPAPEPVTDAPVEVTTAQFNTSGFTGSVSTYFTIGTSDSSTITISFGVEIILKMTKEKTFTFVFVLQVRSSGTVTETFSSMASLAALSGVRQETVMGRAEVNEEGTDTTTFVSALDRQNKTSTSNNTECLYTMEVILMKIQFTNKLTGELYPCDLDNQANAEPPYLEIIDHYNNTVINRYCYLDKNVSIHSFGDQMFGYIVTNGDPNIVPDIQAVQIKEEFCCGGVFYGAFRVPLIIPSPDYPQYKPHMRCPFVFRCDEDYDDCVIRLEFENFNLASNDVSRSRRQALNESDFGNGTAATTLAPYVPPTGPDFNRTICAGEDVVRVSQCGSISAINSREFCADNPPSQVYTGYKEVLLYFDSNDERQDQGFVIKFTPKDRRKWIYSDAELEPKCTCAHNLPNQIRKYFRKRNKNKTNKAKANKEPLRRVRREEREKLKERRTVEKEGRLPERRTRKPKNEENKDRSANDQGKKREEDVEGPKRKRKQKNEENKDRSTNDQGKNREDNVEGPKRRRKKMKKMEGGDSNTEGQNKGKNGRDKEEKDGEKPQGRKKKRMNVGDKDRDAENQNKKKKNGGDIEENVNGPKRRRKNGGGGNEENAKRQKRRRKNGGGGNVENAKRQKRRRKKIGNTNASENEGGNQREQKKIAKDRRKDTLLEKKEKRLQRKNKNGEEDMPMTRAFNGQTNRKRQQYPWLVSVIQYERPLVKNKVKGDRPVERLCGGTLLSDRYVLTTTSCCTYCKTVWEKKNKKNIKLRKKRDAEGEDNKMANKRKRRKKEEDKKGEVKEGEDDMDTEKKGGNQRRRRKNKKTNEELENGGKNRDKNEKAKGIGKGKGMKRGDKKTDKENDNDDDNKGKGKKKGDKKKNDKENDNDDDNKGKGKGKKKGGKKNDKDNDNDDDDKGKGKGKKKGGKKNDKDNDNDDDDKGKGKGKKKGGKKNDKENDNDDDDKGKGKRKKKGDKKKNDNQNDNDDTNKNKKRRKGEKRGNKKKEDREKGTGNGQGDTAPRQNQNKRRRPLKKDVGAIIGEGSINTKKLGDVKPLKIGGIFIPSDCYDKMGKTELNGEPLYPVECPVLLKLKKKVKFNRFIKPMCMPIFDKIKINKERAASLGYGTRKASKTEPSKLPAEVINMRVLKKCEKRLKMKLDKTMICTKGKKKSGHMCFFDEGAPLLNVKVTGSGYKQHANLYGALVVPSCQLEDKKKKKNRREKRDTDETEPKEKRRKLRRRKQETPGTATASKPRQEAKRQGKEGAPGDRPKRKKKLRKMGDVGGEESQQTKPKKLRRKLGRQGQKDKKSILQDGGGDKYNPRKYNKFYIDVWVNIRSYKKWILNVVFNKKKAKACQRPKHFKSVPDIAKKFEIEDPCPY